MAGVRFWDRERVGPGMVTFVEFYEIDGATELEISGDKEKGDLPAGKAGKNIKITKSKAAYGVIMRPATDTIESIREYNRFPIVPFYCNDEKISELTRPIKSKIDFLDVIWTNFGDSASRINIIYWILNNYSVTQEEAIQMIEDIVKLGIVSAKDDHLNAEAKAFEFPSESVEKAIEIIERAITNDFGGVYIKDVVGGSQTNVALNIAFDNFMNKIARYEWQPFVFIQSLMEVIGLTATENISLKYETPRNMKEFTDMVINASEYLDEQTVLEKLPFVSVDEVDVILKRKAPPVAAATPPSQANGALG
jgi:hypothetical protein